jgi:hypothetical protein
MVTAMKANERCAAGDFGFQRWTAAAKNTFDISLHKYKMSCGELDSIHSIQLHS